MEPCQERKFFDQRQGPKNRQIHERRQPPTKPGSKNPANGGPFLSVSMQRQNCRLDGGGRSRMRTGLRGFTGINRAKLQISTFWQARAHQKLRFCGPFAENSRQDASGNLGRICGKINDIGAKTAMNVRASASLKFMLFVVRWRMILDCRDA